MQDTSEDTSNQLPTAGNPFQLRADEAAVAKGQEHVHRFGIRCATDTLGRAQPQGRSPREIVVDATEGFVPLWEKGTTLRWRFKESSLKRFADPQATKREIRKLMGEALLGWGKAVPVKFSEVKDAWDFQVVVRAGNDCDINGCVLAAAFFPDSGRHDLEIYPKMFEQSREEQVATLVHEFGHVFGLRHFFANISETEWRSEIFGEHNPFGIMNYGDESVLTDADKTDLARLYQLVWKGQLTDINGTPIRLVRPYHASGVELS